MTAIFIAALPLWRAAYDVVCALACATWGTMRLTPYSASRISHLATFSVLYVRSGYADWLPESKCAQAAALITQILQTFIVFFAFVFFPAYMLPKLYYGLRPSFGLPRYVARPYEKRW